MTVSGHIPHSAAIHDYFVAARRPFLLDPSYLLVLLLFPLAACTSSASIGPRHALHARGRETITTRSSIFATRPSSLSGMLDMWLHRSSSIAIYPPLKRQARRWSCGGCKTRRLGAAMERQVSSESAQNLILDLPLLIRPSLPYPPRPSSTLLFP